MPTESLLRADDVHYTFGPTVALDGASVDVARGEVLALVGPSGSGKSTLLHCLAGILVPDDGRILYDGERIDRLSDGARSALRRRDFGFIFQFAYLVPELSATENIALAMQLNGTRRRAAETQAREWLARLDVEDVAHRRPGEMSGGQIQRVAVARALAHGPRVVFADEPTGALDTANADTVMDLMTGRARENGAAIVLVTHDERVARSADRRVLIHDGVAGEAQVR